jgi:hypothetical protein
MWSDDVVSIVRPIWILSQLFLMCPKAIHEEIKKKKRRRTSQIYEFVYSTVAILSTVYITYATSNFKILPNINTVTQLAHLLFNASNNISMLSTTFFCLLYQNKLTKLISRLHKIEIKLKRSFKWKSYKSVKIFVVCELLFTLSIWIPFFVTYVLVQASGTFWMRFYNWLVIYTSTKISQVLVMEFCTFVVVL